MTIPSQKHHDVSPMFSVFGRRFVKIEPTEETDSVDIEKLLEKMTVEEKIGQLQQLPPFFFNKDLKSEVAGPLKKINISEAQVFLSGSVLGAGNPEEMREIQNIYLARSRLRIPLVFMADVIHGYKTIFPIPLAIASSFNPDLAYQAAKIAAVEATSSGLSVTFSPMSDLSRDARWGRVMEGYGEDPYLNYRMSHATVKGYQQDDLRNPKTMAACFKHFAAYGAPLAGREYSQAELSLHSFYQYYLDGYQGAIDAGARLAMSAFNVFEGIPATVNKRLLKDILRDQLGFAGIIISDYDSLVETIDHPYSLNQGDAAYRGMEATLDMEMCSATYAKHLKSLIAEGRLSMSQLDAAVLRILKLKDDLGLFEDPYRGIDATREKTYPFDREHLNIALESALESIVLLKNDGDILPLRKSEKIVFVGSLLAEKNLLGSWSWHGDPALTESISEHLSTQNTKTILTDDITEIGVADRLALKGADKVVVVVGERSHEFGEARAKMNPALSERHEQLVKCISDINKNVIVVVLAGRPLVITSIEKQAPGLLYAFYLGSKAAAAIVRTLYGDSNPSAKLPMCLPYAVGQIPISYQTLNTGRPFQGQSMTYTSHYIDGPTTPLFPFGYGKSYADVSFVSCGEVKHDGSSILFDVVLKNNSPIGAKEVVLIYLNPPRADVVLPLRQLVSFGKASLKDHETVTLSMSIDKARLTYADKDYRRVSFGGKLDFEIVVDNKTVYNFSVKS